MHMNTHNMQFPNVQSAAGSLLSTGDKYVHAY